MHYHDLATYQYNLPAKLKGVLTVGWLEKGTAFPFGDVSPRFLERLLGLIVHKRVNVMRGLHYCDFCSEEEVRVEADGERDVLGHAEVWVPSVDGATIFAAPTLIYHYITNHQYLPPKPFLEAVERFDATSTWDGQDSRNRLVSALFAQK
jgi:hypothetical protein